MTRVAQTTEQKTAKRRVRWAEAFDLVARGEARDLVVQCVALVEEGLGIPEISERLEKPRSTVAQALADPMGKRGKARKLRYASKCVDCGGLCNTDGSRAEPSRRCAKCATEKQIREAKERIIKAIQDWYRRYGFVPSAFDWNPAMAQERAHPERWAEIVAAHKDRHWPTVSGVQGVFGSWSAGIKAAGFTPTPTGLRTRPELHKQHLRKPKGDPVSSPLTAETVLEREIEKQEGQLAQLREQVSEREENLERLKLAQKALSNGSKS